MGIFFFGGKFNLQHWNSIDFFCISNRHVCGFSSVFSKSIPRCPCLSGNAEAGLSSHNAVGLLHNFVLAF